MFERELSAPASIGLLVTTYNRPDALAQVLAGVARQGRRPDEIVVADDGSGEATAAVVAHWRARLGGRLARVWQPNRGYRRARCLNLALAASRSDYIVILDGDCVPPAHFVGDHGALAESGHWVQGGRCRVAKEHAAGFRGGEGRPGVRRLRGWIEWVPNYFRWPWAWVNRRTERIEVLGCNFAAWRKDLVAVNGFDERFEGWGYEDSDLGFRLVNAGVRGKKPYGRAFVYHLDHTEVSRHAVQRNNALREEARSGGRIRAKVGLDLHLAGAAESVRD